MNTRIDLVINPADDARAAILKPLRAYNVSKAGDPAAEAVALLVRDETGNEVTGGLYAEVLYRWLFIELLAVPEHARGQGVGSRLMQMAEEFARSRDCVGIWLDTFDFQAPAFYKRHGFSEFAQLGDFPPGHKRYFLQKRLV